MLVAKALVKAKPASQPRACGGSARAVLAAALLQVFRREEAENEGGHEAAKQKSGGKTKQQGGGLDKRQLVERLNARSRGSGEGDDVAPDDGLVQVDERAVGVALKGLVSRGVLRVHQGRWLLVPQPSAAATAAAALSSSQQDDANGEEQEPPAGRERKKNNKWEKLPHGVSEVVPGFLYLGSARDAEDEAQLKALGITHVLNVAKEWPKPRHCKYLDSLAAYKRVPLEDRLSETLFPLMDEAFAFIELARSNPASRVLVHCVLGKSRSVLTVVAYLVRYQGMTLRQAYLHVLERRRAVVVVRPNRSFVNQLMGWERVLAVAEPTLTWDDIDTGFATFQEWLADASLNKAPPSGSRSRKGRGTAETAGTHLWWTIGDKPEYFIPPEREAEMLSEYAKAHLRGEELCLIERRTSPHYRLYFDLDIKCSFADDQPRPPLHDVLQIFLPTFTTVFGEFFEGDALGPRAKAVALSVSGASGPFAFSPRPEVNWKYGFHLVWDLPITVPKHRGFLKALVKHLEPHWGTDGEGEASGDGAATTIPDYIRRHNQLSELIDSAIFTSTDTLRVLYSSKTLACKACKSRQPSGPRKGKQKPTTTTTKKKKKRGKECADCRGTGVREGRVYEWLGFFDASSGLHDASRTAALQPPPDAALGTDAVRLVRGRVEACSIRLPPSATLGLTSTADQATAC